MIPLELSLKNFFSYRKAFLDFRGLHTACISGPNGAGKSSLLEAITWAIWGESRAKTKDDVILAGASDVRVDFKFILNEQTYRVIRTNQRGHSGTLDFQILLDSGQFKSINRRTMKDTQDGINSELKLDYDTFINSAYLRQGKADEFMLKGPGDRKQVLAKILKLDHYDTLAEQAHNQAKDYKIQEQQIQARLTTIEEELQQQRSLESEKLSIDATIQTTKLEQQNEQEQLQELQKQQSQRQFWEAQIKQLEQHYTNSQQEVESLTLYQNNLNSQLQKKENVIAKEEEISNNYQKFQQLQEEDDDLKTRFQEYQNKDKQKQEREKTKDARIKDLENNIFKQSTELAQLEKQEQESQKILNESTAIEAGLKQLIEKREYLQELDKIQRQISPLTQRKLQLETDIERSQVKLVADIEQATKEANLLNSDIGKRLQIMGDLNKVLDKLEELDKKKVYLERVEEKINDKKLLKQKIEQTQELYERDLKEIEKKRNLLDTPEATCPICQSSLEEAHRAIIIQQMEEQTEQIKNNIWTSHEDSNLCNKELNELQNEAKQLKKELQLYGELQQKLSQHETKLDDLAQKEVRINNELNPFIEQWQEKLNQEDYAIEARYELKQIIKKITELNYNEQTHSLIRSEVDRLRQYDFKNTELEKAKEKQANFNKRKPIILETIERLEGDIVELKNNSPLQEEIQKLSEAIKLLNYDQAYHHSVSTQLRQVRDAETQYQQLQEYKQELPSLKAHQQEQEEVIKNKVDSLWNQAEQIKVLQVQIQEYKDYTKQIEDQKTNLQEIQVKLENLNHQKGGLEHRLKLAEQLAIEHKEKRKLKGEIHHKVRVYEALEKAFGKKGIQAIMIENIIPHLEAETNYTLSRLTQNQLHVSFVTQKNASSGSKKNRENKTIDTLDILVADNNTTRPYEGYSGGEAFRVNFSIRLALSRILAQRAGTSLKLLIIDEGFGTQDAEGCERLIAAINEIADDFACILTVTHISQFKEAFQQRIEVRKTNEGSEVLLIT